MRERGRSLVSHLARGDRDRSSLPSFLPCLSRAFCGIGRNTCFFRPSFAWMYSVNRSFAERGASNHVYFFLTHVYLLPSRRASRHSISHSGPTTTSTLKGEVRYNKIASWYITTNLEKIWLHHLRLSYFVFAAIQNRKPKFIADLANPYCIWALFAFARRKFRRDGKINR